MLDRQQVLAAIRAAIEPLPYALAMWEGGAPSFNRADEWSDIDLQIVTEDERLDEVFPILEAALQSLSPIDLKYELARPTWHGHAQAFYRLKQAGPYLLLDLVVMKRSAKEMFLTSEIHGQALVHFDKVAIVQPPPLDWVAHNKILRARLQILCTKFDLFQSMVWKETNRGNGIEALTFYQAYTLSPLIELLGIRYRPARYNFGTRYIYYEFPPEVVRHLEALYFVPGPDQIPALQKQAGRWFRELADEAQEWLITQP
jgi:hypothetical protein